MLTKYANLQSVISPILEKIMANKPFLTDIKTLRKRPASTSNKAR